MPSKIDPSPSSVIAPRSSRVRLELPVAMLRYLKGVLRRNRRDMIGTPRRFARFSVLAVGQLAVVVAIALKRASPVAGQSERKLSASQPFDG
jgi:hypothetical protein